LTRAHVFKILHTFFIHIAGKRSHQAYILEGIVGCFDIRLQSLNTGFGCLNIFRARAPVGFFEFLLGHLDIGLGRV